MVDETVYQSKQYILLTIEQSYHRIFKAFENILNSNIWYYFDKYLEPFKEKKTALKSIYDKNEYQSHTLYNFLFLNELQELVERGAEEVAQQLKAPGFNSQPYTAARNCL